MAVSGSVSTDKYDGRYYTVEWTATQSIEDNKSTVKWTLKAVGGNVSWYAERTLKVVLGGKTVYSKTDRVSRYTGTVASGTQVITHDTNGNASFAISIQAAVYYSTVNCTGSQTFTLNPIPRKSTLTVANGTLGTAQTLTITEKVSTFKHKLTYSCGSVSGYILGGASSFSTALSVDWTPPKTLANQNTAGTSVSIKFTLYTYTSNGTLVGSNSYTKTFYIPDTAEFRPSCTISVSDAFGYESMYGEYIEGQSKLIVTITPTLAYGSEIASYSATANGARYSTAKFTTGVLVEDGKMTISATVTDKRGRSGTATLEINVVEYAKPLISLLKVKRCVSLEDGTEKFDGEFCQVTFSASFSSVIGFNRATYILEYKKSADSWDNCTSVELVDHTNTYVLTEATHRFPAESGSSYNVRLLLKDNFTEDNPIIKVVPLSTAEVMEHWRADAKGMGFGKIGEVEDGADFGWKIKANKGFINIPLEANTDVNEVILPNTYVSYDKVASTYKNIPEELIGGTFTLYVASGGNEGQISQTITATSKENFKVWVRHYHATDGVFSWGEWHLIYSFTGQVLWDGSAAGSSGGYYMTETQSITLPQAISEQPTGIVLVFQAYADGSVVPSDFNTFFIPKGSVADNNGQGRCFICTTTRFGYVGIKYIYISDTQLTGNTQNDETGTAASGITYTNNRFVLTKVYGV